MPALHLARAPSRARAWVTHGRIFMFLTRCSLDLDNTQAALCAASSNTRTIQHIVEQVRTVGDFTSCNKSIGRIHICGRTERCWGCFSFDAGSSFNSSCTNNAINYQDRNWTTLMKKKLRKTSNEEEIVCRFDFQLLQFFSLLFRWEAYLKLVLVKTNKTSPSVLGTCDCSFCCFLPFIWTLWWISGINSRFFGFITTGSSIESTVIIPDISHKLGLKVSQCSYKHKPVLTTATVKLPTVMFSLFLISIWNVNIQQEPVSMQPSLCYIFFLVHSSV